jgi:hypothetical protein
MAMQVRRKEYADMPMQRTQKLLLSSVQRVIDGSDSVIDDPLLERGIRERLGEPAPNPRVLKPAVYRSVVNSYITAKHSWKKDSNAARDPELDAWLGAFDTASLNRLVCWLDIKSIEKAKAKYRKETEESREARLKNGRHGSSHINNGRRAIDWTPRSIPKGWFGQRVPSVQDFFDNSQLIDQKLGGGKKWETLCPQKIWDRHFVGPGLKDKSYVETHQSDRSEAEGPDSVFLDHDLINEEWMQTRIDALIEAESSHKPQAEMPAKTVVVGKHTKAQNDAERVKSFCEMMNFPESVEFWAWRVRKKLDPEKPIGIRIITDNSPVAKFYENKRYQDWLKKYSITSDFNGTTQMERYNSWLCRNLNSDRTDEKVVPWPPDHVLDSLGKYTNNKLIVYKAAIRRYRQGKSSYQQLANFYRFQFHGVRPVSRVDSPPKNLPALIPGEESKFIFQTVPKKKKSVTSETQEQQMENESKLLTAVVTARAEAEVRLTNVVRRKMQEFAEDMIVEFDENIDALTQCYIDKFRSETKKYVSIIKTDIETPEGFSFEGRFLLPSR